MAIEAFSATHSPFKKPKILVLEVRSRLEPSGKPMAWLVVERIETSVLDPVDGAIDNAAIRIRYHQVTPRPRDGVRRTAEFQASFNRAWNTTCLTSHYGGSGAVFLDLPGLEGNRIGSYMMNEIVSWARRWPDASVKPIQLLSLQAQAENKDRRNRFYEQFNIRFEYTDLSKSEGTSFAMTAGDLTPSSTWEANIREVNMLEFITSQMAATETAAWRIEDLERGMARLVSERQRTNHNNRSLVSLACIFLAGCLFTFWAMRWFH